MDVVTVTILHCTFEYDFFIFILLTKELPHQTGCCLWTEIGCKDTLPGYIPTCARRYSFARYKMWLFFFQNGNKCVSKCLLYSRLEYAERELIWS